MWVAIYYVADAVHQHKASAFKYHLENNTQKSNAIDSQGEGATTLSYLRFISQHSKVEALDRLFITVKANMHTQQLRMFRFKHLPTRQKMPKAFVNVFVKSVNAHRLGA
jgi:hypothetical protein